MGKKKSEIEADTRVIQDELKVMGVEKSKGEMIAEIKAATDRGLSMNTIDKGARYCCSICDGKEVSDYQVCRIYRNLVKIQAQSKEEREAIYNNVERLSTVENKPVTKASKAKSSKRKEKLYTEKAEENSKPVDNVYTEDRQRIEELSILRERVAMLEKEVAKLKAAQSGILPGRQKKSILGWTPSLRSTSGNCKFWYVSKRIAGKLVCVYIGKDLGQAENKIHAYCEKHGLNLGESK